MAGFFKKLFNKVTNKAEIDWDDLEADLISGDLGVKLSLEIVDDLKELGRKISADDVVETTRSKLSDLFPADSPTLQPRSDGKPCVLLIVGVNGTGKTTSTAKLGHLLKSQGHSVLMAAADTFRAAAVEQLVRWGERLDLPVVTGAHEADPSSVCYQAHQQAINGNYDFLLCDTAGRLHTRNNLMDELTKIKRTILLMPPLAATPLTKLANSKKRSRSMASSSPNSMAQEKAASQQPFKKNSTSPPVLLELVKSLTSSNASNVSASFKTSSNTSSTADG